MPKEATVYQCLGAFEVLNCGRVMIIPGLEANAIHCILSVVSSTALLSRTEDEVGSEGSNMPSAGLANHSIVVL